MTVAYLLLRVSDYYEDNEILTPAEKISRLHLWASVLEGEEQVGGLLTGPSDLDENLADVEAAVRAAEIVEAFHELPARVQEILRGHIVASTLGMARWVQRGSDFGNEKDLDDYMFEVAGRVGLLLTDLFAEDSRAVRQHLDRMQELGRGFGLGLQTVNVIRGLNTDVRRGWTFIPRTFLPPGSRMEDLWAAPSSERSLLVLNRMVAKAENHLEAALQYCLALPRLAHGIRVFCLLPLFFAARTLALSRGNPEVFHSEVKLVRSEVSPIVIRTKFLAASNSWIETYYRRLIA